MEMDIIQIAICISLFLLTVVSSLCTVLFRRITHTIHADNQNTLPKISIVIPAHDSAVDLQKNLPYFLSQVYEPGFEVIVVDESSTDNTNDVLTLLKTKYSNLYTTFIPTSSKYLSRRKLALTIGVKAAHNEWVIFSNADCRPNSDNWLHSLSLFCNDNYDIIMGYTQFDADTKSFYRFERMHSSWQMFNKALKGTAYRHCGANLAIRKSDFIKHNGFLKNLKYLRGEYDFIVNEYATRGRTAIVTSKDAFMIQDNPFAKTWMNTHLSYIETRKHLKRSFAYRFMFNMDMLMLHLNYIVQISALAYSIYSNNIALMTTSACCILTAITLRVSIAKKACKYLSENISAFKIPFMETGLLWNNIRLLIKYMTADKYDFIRK